MKRARAQLTRRDFLRGSAAALVASSCRALAPSYAWAAPSRAADARVLDGQSRVDLRVRAETLPIADGLGRAITLNGTVPGPLVRLREAQDVTLRVTNELDVDTSVHWHGILLPYQMDGVPGLSFRGIAPGETFTYRYRVQQSGTYWYHSHSGLQDQSGHYGPLIVDPLEPDPFTYDRDYVVMLSDWSFEDPHHILARLKGQSDYYSYGKRTLLDFADDVASNGWRSTLADRLAWGAMRMDATDIADVTGITYTYLMNGLSAGANWTGLFTPGERIRLRIINGSAMSYFNVRVPGLAMTVVQADGQNVEPIDVDELQIATAETYDVIVAPTGDRAYTVFAEAMDRSGFARGTLAPRSGLQAAVPELRKPPHRTLADMGMSHHAMSGHDPHAAHHRAAEADARDGVSGLPAESRLDEPGAGLADAGHRVLVYTDLMRIARDFDPRPPSRELEFHLTGNMERYMWSFDGEKFSEVTQPIEFHRGERLRVTLVNDTMMEHPIHLHGMWMELENGRGSRIPRKHTVSVKPAERLSVLINADPPGPWAFHCHLLFHMEMGMFRVVRVA
ncbi:MAG TPA: copper resistance system multicopper oxidase [Myxococcota bacterium]|nr:copper resistance system multicopper oxidase [Myxococcota bacterium]